MEASDVSVMEVRVCQPIDNRLRHGLCPLDPHSLCLWMAAAADLICMAAGENRRNTPRCLQPEGNARAEGSPADQHGEDRQQTEDSTQYRRNHL